MGMKIEKTRRNCITHHLLVLSNITLPDCSLCYIEFPNTIYEITYHPFKLPRMNIKKLFSFIKPFTFFSFEVGKRTASLLFRPQSFWVGVYPNKYKGKVCIAFFPLLVLRINKTDSALIPEVMHQRLAFHWGMRYGKLRATYPMTMRMPAPRLWFRELRGTSFKNADTCEKVTQVEALKYAQYNPIQ